MTTQPIENYALIGDMRAAALVSVDGCVDWLCLPRFDSPSVFGAILDGRSGGSFELSPPSQSFKRKQFYLPDSNVLVTRFLADTGVGQITDFMPLGVNENHPWRHCLVRQLRVLRGEVRFSLRCCPRPNYSRGLVQVVPATNGVVFEHPQQSFMLSSTTPLQRIDGGVQAEVLLHDGEEISFAFGVVDSDRTPTSLGEDAVEALIAATVDYWRRWLSQCSYTGRWREMVHRSALALKLLTYEPSGAIVAAPTTSLPENLGGERNWDYRYTWIRDASFTLYALLRIGFTEEARNFMGWLEARAHEIDDNGALQIMYGIDGCHNVDERVLDHLNGYQGSKPVRIGNGAFKQLQLDIYGELLDSVYLYDKYGSPISYDLWTYVSRMVDWTADHWHLEDEGIWEVRSGRKHFVYSKLMCWVALDRGLRLAEKRSLPANRTRWVAVRDAIYRDIMTHGWDTERQAFVQYYGGFGLDAANLLMPMVFFLSPSDPRFLRTLEATMAKPEEGGLVSNSLVYRYNLADTDDGLNGGEGTFNICTFWLVEALTRAGHTRPELIDRARLIFEEMLGYANHVGLYAEQTGASGEALGNFPQAFTHIALISAAFNLNRALDEVG